LASFSRLILFDKRGTGLSDRFGEVASLEERMDDVRAVMDAVGSERAALFGISEGGAMSMLFAATYPERTRALVLYGTYGHFPLWVLPPDRFKAFWRCLSVNGGLVRPPDFSRLRKPMTGALNVPGHASNGKERAHRPFWPCFE
jgi:pimeloyl-ACP methyl ester carboxylesterase